MGEERLQGLVESRPRNVLSLVAVLNARGANGVLRFEPGPEPEFVEEFLFRDGKLLFATTNRPGCRTGEFLVRRNIISNELATAALLNARGCGQLFHGYLVERGFVDRDTMQTLLYERTEELFHTVYTANEGRFVFEQSQLRRFDRQVPIVDPELFARLLTYRNLWPQAFEKLWQDRPVLRQVRDVESHPAFQFLSEPERRALSWVTGRHPVDRILEGRRDRVEFSIRLAQFLESGLIEKVLPEPAPDPVAVAAPPQPSLTVRPSPVPTEAPPAARKVEVREVREGDSSPIDLEVLPAFAAGIDLTRIPSTGLSMDELFVLSQLDGKTSLQQLISITQIAEKPLFRLMHFLVRQGFVELRPRQVQGPPVRTIRQPSRVTTASPASSFARESVFAREPVSSSTTAAQPAPATSFQSPSSVTAPPPPVSKPEPAAPPRMPVPPSVAPVVTASPVFDTSASGFSATSEVKKSPAFETPAPPKARIAMSTIEREAEALRLHQRAITSYNVQNYSGAEELLQRSLRLNTGSSRARAHLALALLEVSGNRLEEAQRLVEEAFEEDPLESQCLEAMGLIKIRVGDYGRAWPLLETAVLLDRKRVPSSLRLLEELKGYQPKRGERPEELWSKIRRNIRLLP